MRIPGAGMIDVERELVVLPASDVCYVAGSLVTNGDRQRTRSLLQVGTATP
jgi:hypothetical protein